MVEKLDKLQPPVGAKKILLHCCCAPCSGGIIKQMLDSELDFAIFFYNPNIHPKAEYEHRKREIFDFADRNSVPVIEADYDVHNWVDSTRGLENEPERGKRCTACFDIRLKKTAQYAQERGFDLFATSLGSSRWKDLEQINESGRRAAESCSGVNFWSHNWRKDGLQECAAAISKEENFYRQDYCGCVYSLKEADVRQKKNEKRKESPTTYPQNG